MQGVDLSDPEAAARSEEALSVCERVQEEWGRLISSTLQQEAQRTPQGGHGAPTSWMPKDGRWCCIEALLRMCETPLVG